MFRSVFTKYITVFMLIIIISFIIQLSIISTLIGNYSDNAKNLEITRAALAFSSYLEDRLNESLFYYSLERLCEGSPVTISTSLRTMLNFANHMSFLVTDTNGVVLFNKGDGLPKDIEDNIKVSHDIVNNVVKNSYYLFEPTQDDPIFGKNLIVCGVVVKKDNAVVGISFACSTNAGLADAVLDSIIKTVVLSSLWIMLAALIAVYFISDRVISPIKSMRNAAKSFAAGNFDVRVPVVGHDEVAELASAFNNMANSLAHLEEMRNTFLENVSHDLRTPMTTISGFIDSILDGAIPPSQEKYYLNIISNEVKRLSRLVTTLLDITRMQAGERKFTKTAFDICEMARQILISMESRINDKKLIVEFNCDHENMYVSADRDAIHQIFYNLCDNAVKFSREGGKLRVTIRSYARKTHVYVYNEGQGIAEADLPFIFERFYKSDKSRGLDKTGVGLGLYIVKSIIDAHGETIDVKSEYGSYCEFHFTLEPN